MASTGWCTRIAVCAVTSVFLMSCRDEPAQPIGDGRQTPDANEPTRTPRDGNAPTVPRPLGEDARAMVGRRVALTLPFHDVANDVAFWADIDDRRMLVVTNRDVRDAAQRQQGLPPRHHIAASAGAADGAAQILISGTVEQLPPPEARYSWGLTSTDRADVARQGVYLRADSIEPADNPAAF
jgi:hypothetical protein